MFGSDCAIARESVSADLDGELQELELFRLRAHLRVCADCSTWAEDVTATTVRLREAPYPVPVPDPFVLPHRGRMLRVNPAVAIAPVVALVAGVVVSLSGAQHGSLGGQPTTGTSASSPDHRSNPVRKHVPLEQHWVLRPV